MKQIESMTQNLVHCKCFKKRKWLSVRTYSSCFVYKSKRFNRNLRARGEIDMKLIETHCHGKDCERKNNCYRYVILQEKLKKNPSQALWYVQSSSCNANN